MDTLFTRLYKQLLEYCGPCRWTLLIKPETRQLSSWWHDDAPFSDDTPPVQFFLAVRRWECGCRNYSVVRGLRISFNTGFDTVFFGSCFDLRITA